MPGPHSQLGDDDPHPGRRLKGGAHVVGGRARRSPRRHDRIRLCGQPRERRPGRRPVIADPLDGCDLHPAPGERMRQLDLERVPHLPGCRHPGGDDLIARQQQGDGAGAADGCRVESADRRERHPCRREHVAGPGQQVTGLRLAPGGPDVAAGGQLSRGGVRAQADAGGPVCRRLCVLLPHHARGPGRHPPARHDRARPAGLQGGLERCVLEVPWRFARDGVPVHRGGRDVGDRLGGAQIGREDPAV